MSDSACIVVGYGLDGHGRAGVELARMLAQSCGWPLVISCVIPERWVTVGPGRAVDEDYDAFLRDQAESALRDARERIGALDSPVSVEVRTARSAPVGLEDAVAEHAARVLVVGSSGEGAWGHVSLGSVSNHLVHGSPVPVALAPRGFRQGAPSGVTRISVAIDGTDTSAQVIAGAADWAAHLRVPLRPMTFAVRAGRSRGAGVGPRAEEEIVAAWRRQMTELVPGWLAAAGAPERGPRHHGVGGSDGVGGAYRVEALEMYAGGDWEEALGRPEWVAGEVLVLGSSRSQSLPSRVFLGSTAAQIMRHSPVPLLILP